MTKEYFFKSPKYYLLSKIIILLYIKYFSMNHPTCVTENLGDDGDGGGAASEPGSHLDHRDCERV